MGRGQRPYGIEKQGEARQLRREGYSIREIAQMMGVSKSAVGAWVVGFGEFYRVRNCALCGEEFLVSAVKQEIHVYCCEEHGQKAYKMGYRRGRRPDQ